VHSWMVQLYPSEFTSCNDIKNSAISIFGGGQYLGVIFVCSD
jgi:hypothetical protein